MKIEGPKQTDKTGKAGKSGKAGKADGSFGDFMASAPKEAAQTQATKSIARVDALLAAQAVEDPAARAARRRMRERGEGVLRELDRMRHALLTGTLTVGHIIDIADVVASHRERIADPAMTALLDEIDLRAQIELAKARRALGQGPARD